MIRISLESRCLKALCFRVVDYGRVIFTIHNITLPLLVEHEKYKKMGSDVVRSYLKLSFLEFKIKIQEAWLQCMQSLEESNDAFSFFGN